MLLEGKTPCARCAKKKADEAAAKAKAKAEYDFNHPCDVCSKDKKDKEELTVPIAVNATHTTVPVTEEVEKVVIIKDEKTGEEKKTKVKVPETKSKVVMKVPPVAQNSTHEVIPVTDIEEKEVPVADSKSGKVKMVIEKVPVTKNKVVPKNPAAAAAVPPLAVPAAETVASPVAQNSTHSVVPVTTFEEKEEAQVDPLTN